MQFIQKILLFFILIPCSVLIAQDSTNSNHKLFDYTIASGIHSTDYVPQSLSYKFFDPQKKEHSAMASQPIFVNSERPLIDGTIWRS